MSLSYSRAMNVSKHKTLTSSFNIVAFDSISTSGRGTLLRPCGAKWVRQRSRSDRSLFDWRSACLDYTLLRELA